MGWDGLEKCLGKIIIQTIFLLISNFLTISRGCINSY